MKLVVGSAQGESNSPIVPVPVEKAGVVIILARSMIVLSRPKNGADEWVLPKGHVEDGEDFATCAIREALEETGAVLKPITDPEVSITERDVPATDSWPEEHERVHWFIGKAVAVNTERITDLNKDGSSRKIGIFPATVALAKLTYPEQRGVLATVISGDEGVL